MLKNKLLGDLKSEWLAFIKYQTFQLVQLNITDVKVDISFEARYAFVDRPEETHHLGDTTSEIYVS